MEGDEGKAGRQPGTQSVSEALTELIIMIPAFCGTKRKTEQFVISRLIILLFGQKPFITPLGVICMDGGRH